MTDLSTKSTWVFDLDNTLYPADCDLFHQVDQKIGAFVERLTGLNSGDARTYQKKLFMAHGTTLNGLMIHHSVDPDDYLAFVHDIDFSPVERDDRLRAALQRLPGRHVIYTNADAEYSERILNRLGIQDLFDGIFDVKAADFKPKPDPEPYTKLLKDYSIDPTDAVMVEDMARNLRPAHALGMETVWIDTGTPWGRADHDPSIITHEIEMLSQWLDDHTQHLAETS